MYLCAMKELTGLLVRENKIVFTKMDSLPLVHDFLYVLHGLINKKGY